MKTEIVVPNPDRVIVCLDVNSPSGVIEFVPAVKITTNEDVELCHEVGPQKWVTEPLVTRSPVKLTLAMLQVLVGSV